MKFCHRFVQLYGSESCTINMHLHGHLCQCIKDYGPVYSFWCFSFERLNGILGSYHTNNHHISVQLAQRFLDSKIYAPHNWPKEYVDEFLPLLHRYDYNKGSLMQTSLQNDLRKEVQPLPPAKERAFQSWQIEDLNKVVHTILGTHCRVLRLYRQCNSILLHVGRFQHVLGSERSKYHKSSVVLAKHADSDEIGLASIAFFAECTCVSIDEQRTMMWVAAVSWYCPHPAKIWFGQPTQVWSSQTQPGYSFIPIPNIRSRVVYTKATVNFGRIGCNTVNIIVPVHL